MITAASIVIYINTAAERPRRQFTPQNQVDWQSRKTTAHVNYPN
jgi:hypothetical protein